MADIKTGRIEWTAKSNGQAALTNYLIALWPEAERRSERGAMVIAAVTPDGDGYKARIAIQHSALTTREGIRDEHVGYATMDAAKAGAVEAAMTMALRLRAERNLATRKL